jgi:TolA-binding protein
MKGSERHRLKENELSHVLGDATMRLQENRRTFGLAAGIVALLVIAGIGYWAWTTRSENRAQALLGDAIVIMQAPVADPKPGAKPDGTSYPKPDGTSYPTVQARAEAALVKFADVYTAYPSTDAGIASRYYAASALAMLGRHAEAAARFQETVEQAGANTFYGRMARLGVVETNAQAKKYDEAITAAQALVNNTSDDTIPRDALLMELGRVQVAAGKNTEAKQTLDKIIAEFPDSAYIDEAKRMLAELT